MTRTCASCDEPCGLTVTYHYQNEEYDYCLGCAPEVLREYRQLIEP